MASKQQSFPNISKRTTGSNANNSDNMMQVLTRPPIRDTNQMTKQEVESALENKKQSYRAHSFNNARNRAQQSSNISNLLSHEDYGQHPADPIRPSRKPANKNNAVASYHDIYNPIQVRSTDQLGVTESSTVIQDRPRSPKKRCENNYSQQQTKERGDPITWQRKIDDQNQVSKRRSVEISSRDSRTTYKSSMSGNSMRNLLS